MVRKYFLALTVLAAFFLVAAGPVLAGWGYSSEPSREGSSMSSEPAAPQGAVESSGPHQEGMEATEYQHEEALGTGRLPESGETGNVTIFGDDVERQLQEGIVTGGP